MGGGKTNEGPRKEEENQDPKPSILKSKKTREEWGDCKNAHLGQTVRQGRTADVRIQKRGLSK